MFLNLILVLGFIVESLGLFPSPLILMILDAVLPSAETNLGSPLNLILLAPVALMFIFCEANTFALEAPDAFTSLVSEIRS